MVLTCPDDLSAEGAKDISSKVPVLVKPSLPQKVDSNYRVCCRVILTYGSN